jgi:hypothetical protein
MGCKVTPSRGAHGAGAARRDDERAQHHELGDCRAIHSERGRGRRRLTARRERRASWAWGWGCVVVQVQEAEGREAGRRQVDTDAGLGAGRVGVAMAMTPLRSPPATPPLTPRRASQTGREAKKGRPAMGVSACGSLSGARCAASWSGEQSQQLQSRGNLGAGCWDGRGPEEGLRRARTGGGVAGGAPSPHESRRIESADESTDREGVLRAEMRTLSGRCSIWDDLPVAAKQARRWRQRGRRRED